MKTSAHASQRIHLQVLPLPDVPVCGILFLSSYKNPKHFSQHGSIYYYFSFSFSFLLLVQKTKGWKRKK
jgi:hypothetical protein